MRRSTNFRFLVMILMTVFVFGAIDTFSQRRKPRIRRRSKRAYQKRAKSYKIERGQRIRVRMQNRISSKESQPGDRFTTKVTEPVYSHTGIIVVPAGSTIIGKIDSVKRARKDGKPGEIDVSFIQIKLPNGTTRKINGSLASLDSKGTKSDNEGTVSAGKMKHRKIIFIGGGGVGGAVLGGIIGGGKGALIGGIIGAGAGLLGGKLKKGKEVKVKSGTEFGVVLNQPLYLPKFTGTDIYAEKPIVNDERPERIEPRVGGERRTYVVQPGDTLGGISRKLYGTSSRYMDIYNANRDKLASPNSVSVGQRLVIPQ